MNELTTEQMEDCIRNVKEHFSRSFAHNEHTDQVIIVDAGAFHNELAGRLQSIADIDNKALIITPEMLDELHQVSCSGLNDLASAINALSMLSPEKVITDFSKVVEAAKGITFKNHKMSDTDDRKWYDVAANKGGKKRKQNYNNRQPWRR